MSRKRPEENMALVLAANGEQTPRSIVKQVTALKAAGNGAMGGIRVPNESDLKVINTFTQKEVTAEEVVVFRTYSANTIVDRDTERFRANTIEEFAKMPAPYGSVGKSFMVSHDTSKLPVGRIFGAGTEMIDGEKFLTNDVYIPKTEANKAFIDNLEMGIYWAVSVGVMLKEAFCTVGKEHKYASRWFCEQGHEKGLFYDPKSTERDDWGWPIPAEEGDKGAQLCVRELSGAKDFYELSQVYLGAQYFAELAKDPELEDLIKAASADLPNLSIPRQKASLLPLQHVNSKVVEAKSQYDVQELPNGVLRWADSEKFVYVYDPESDDVLCVGKARSDNMTKAAELQRKVSELRIKLNDVKLAKGTELDTELVEVIEDGLKGVSDDLDKVTDESKVEDIEASVASIDSDIAELAPDDADDDREDDDEDDDKGAESTMSVTYVTNAAKEAKLPDAVTAKLAEADDGSAVKVALQASAEIIDSLSKQLAEAAPLAAAGKKYLANLRTEVKSAYILANTDSKNATNGGVSTDFVERMLKLAGDDTETLTAMLDQYQKQAGENFPGVRRSSFPTDANKATLSNGTSSDDTKPVELVSAGHAASLESRLHR